VILQSDDIAQWANSLADFSPEYTPVKAWSPIQYYRLSGKRTVIELGNFEPIPDLRYCLYSPQEERYYFKKFNNIPLGSVLFYDTDEAWDSWDRELNNFRQRIDAGLMYLLLTPGQVGDTTEKLVKLYKANLSDDGKLDYKIYIKLVDIYLRYEDYQDTSKSLTGYRTICNQFEEKIAELWKLAHTKK